MCVRFKVDLGWKCRGDAKVLLAGGKNKEEVLELLLAELNPHSKTYLPKQRIKRKKELRLHINKEGKLVLEPLSVHTFPNPQSFRFLSSFGMTKERKLQTSNLKLQTNFKSHPDSYQDKSQIADICKTNFHV